MERLIIWVRGCTRMFFCFFKRKRQYPSIYYCRDLSVSCFLLMIFLMLKQSIHFLEHAAPDLKLWNYCHAPQERKQSIKFICNFLLLPETNWFQVHTLLSVYFMALLCLLASIWQNSFLLGPSSSFDHISNSSKSCLKRKGYQHKVLKSESMMLWGCVGAHGMVAHLWRHH